MAEAIFGNTVKAHFSVKLEDGSVFDSTFDLEPMTFTIGMGQVIPGFEDAVIGMGTGTSKTVTVSADKAFGPYYQELIIKVKRDDFSPDFVFEKGQNLQFLDDTGQQVQATVVNITDTTVTLDKNHPLAGKDLIIDIKLLEIL